MKSFHYTGKTEIIAVSLEPGDLLRESIAQAAKDHDIKVGTVISGIGVLSHASLHHVESTNFPPYDILYEADRPYEINGLDGMIIDYVPHLHISLSAASPEVTLVRPDGSKNTEITYGGHLEDGSVIGYLGEVVIMKFNDFDLERIPHHNEKYKPINQLSGPTNQ